MVFLTDSGRNMAKGLSVFSQGVSNLKNNPQHQKLVQDYKAGRITAQQYQTRTQALGRQAFNQAGAFYTTRSGYRY